MLPECCYDYRPDLVEIEERVVCECEICGAEIYAGDTYYNIDSLIVCSDCIQTCKEVAE